MMEYCKVESSSMKVVGYDPRTKTLEITFNSGRTYRYSRVESEIANGLLNAPSKGGFFADKIVGKYDYRCLNPKPAKGDIDAHLNAAETRPRPSKGKTWRFPCSG